MENKRLDLYLHMSVNGPYYTNTPEEQELVTKFSALYALTKSAQEAKTETNPANLDKWRRAYKGTLNALTKDGDESKRKSRQLKKVAFEIIESIVDNSVPMPKMQARYKDDLPVVNITENYLKFEADRILTKYVNDQSERAVYIDGTGWYKVGWDSLDTTHERSGDVKIDFCNVDQIFPQPGVKDYKQLEYIFERKEVSITRIYDLYGRLVTPTQGNSTAVPIVSCYYLNENRIVGLFMWHESTMQVICNEKDWQIRKIRKCTKCGVTLPQGEECPVCGSKSFKYENAEEEVLDEDIYELVNPYKPGKTTDNKQNDTYQPQIFASAGTTIPYYRVRQLPFVPRPAISTTDSLYGISEVSVVLEMQDGVNKVLTKAMDKTLSSGTVVTKPEQVKISNVDDTFKILGVKTTEQASMIQVKQIVADTSQDLIMGSLLYESSKNSSGVTDSYQGNKDSSATSGKAKEYAALQAAGRIQSMREIKSAAFSGVYELILKYLLAFSDEERRFVRILPDGTQEEQCWNKYLFLAKDKYGQIYYRDDFHFDCDPASTLSQNRQQMWLETTNKFIQGAFGVPSDPRTLRLYWNTMDEFGYPLAKIAIAGIKESERHLPPDVEQAIMQSPQLMQMISQVLSQNKGQGGARENAGRKSNGATHYSNVERTNEKNRASKKSSAFTPQSKDVSTVGQAGGLQ